jgi:hypothetical protein
VRGCEKEVATHADFPSHLSDAIEKVSERMSNSGKTERKSKFLNNVRSTRDTGQMYTFGSIARQATKRDPERGGNRDEVQASVALLGGSFVCGRTNLGRSN